MAHVLCPSLVAASRRPLSRARSLLAAPPLPAAAAPQPHQPRSRLALGSRLHGGSARSSLCCSAGGSLAASASSDTAQPADDAAADAAAALKKTIFLTALFALWYATNIYFNLWNKQLLKMYQFPMTGTAVHFAIGSAMSLAMWLLRIKAPPKVDKDVLVCVIPLAAIHALGNVLTNLSLSAVAVSFTHTIKALEPFFSVMMSWIFLGSVPTAPMLITLLPIVVGVILASASEPSFNWSGFLFAMGSNLTFQSRNVLSKRLLAGAKGLENVRRLPRCLAFSPEADGRALSQGAIDNVNLFSLITIGSFFLTAPAAMFFEGVRFTPAALSAAGVSLSQVVPLVVMAGISFHTYQQVSYMILSRVTPVTHSIGNCVKRVVVIISSVIVFQTPVTLLNGFGTALALAGVFAYSQVTMTKGKKKAAA